MQSISTTSFTKSGSVNELAPSPFGGVIDKRASAMSDRDAEHLVEFTK